MNNLNSEIKRGDVITFGSYAQSDATGSTKEPIEWIVLDIKGARALLISKYALDTQPYNKPWTRVTWETCALRQWLNNDFMDSAFEEAEKARIPTVKISADENPEQDTDPGNDTEDKVFLLSITEAERYFASAFLRICKPTAYAKAQGTWVGMPGGNCTWCLRSPGGNQYNAANVESGGHFNYKGSFVDDSHYAVRPALWINLNDSTVADNAETEKEQYPEEGKAIGETIKFGKYMQSADVNAIAEPIEWQVLDVKDGKALVISKYALDAQRYNESIEAVTWETCTLRRWLNNDFINSAFEEAEKAGILTVNVNADKNPQYDTSPGNDTEDKIFLLSITEAEWYFTSATARVCKPTEYAKAHGAYVHEFTKSCWWWLRSPGGAQDWAAAVYNYGVASYFGNGVCGGGYAVRPAMWVCL